DVQSVGIEKLRQEYAASWLSIKPQTKISKLDTIKEIIRAIGEDPEKLFTREALTEQAITNLTPEEYGNHHIKILQKYIRQLLQQASQSVDSETPIRIQVP